MRITESTLRRIIRSVIAENLEAMGSARKISGTINLTDAEEGNLFEKVKEFMENTLSKIIDPEDIIWNDRYKTCKEELMYACIPAHLRGIGEDIGNYNELLTCEFEVNTKSLGVKNVTLYNFINTCGKCGSFTVKAKLMDDDYDSKYSRGMFGEIVLSIEDY